IENNYNMQPAPPPNAAQGAKAIPSSRSIGRISLSTSRLAAL
ncbi:unnamed protein product, partial [Rotaria sp. Silwood1]